MISTTTPLFVGLCPLPKGKTNSGSFQESTLTYFFLVNLLYSVISVRLSVRTFSPNSYLVGSLEKKKKCALLETPSREVSISRVALAPFARSTRERTPGILNAPQILLVSTTYYIEKGFTTSGKTVLTSQIWCAFRISHA